MKKVLSYNLTKNILFDKMDYGENFLILYDKKSNHKQILKNLMQQIAQDNSTLFYISHTKNKQTFNFDIQNYYFFNVITEKIIHEIKDKLDAFFNKTKKIGGDMFLICDWGDINLNDCEIFIPFLEGLIKYSKGLKTPNWKRGYREPKQKNPFIIINEFETTNLENEFIKQIISMHKRIYLLQENNNTFSLPTISPSLETIFPKSYVLPQKVLEKLAKNNLELISLLLLEKKDKSGYQILKDIANHFHCILSQGTLYPLLYQLEREKKIVKHNGKGREVIYSLNQKTRKDLQLKKETYLKTYQHLASFFELGGGGNSKSNK